MTTVFDRMSAEQRLIAVNVDISKDKRFARLSGVACIGDVKVAEENDPSCQTAMTDGSNEWYNRKFVLEQSRKQLRYIKLHETSHKALRHCTEYMEISRKLPEATGIAMDIVINMMLEEEDPNFDFIERPTSVAPLIVEEYAGWSFVRIVKDLMKNAKPIGGGQPGKGQPGGGQPGQGQPGQGQPGPIGQIYVDPKGKPLGMQLDKHIMGKIVEAELKQLNRSIDDALHQGKLVQEKLAGKGSASSALDATMQKRDTNWKQHLREFISSLCEGDDFSRFSPPNKRLLPQGIIMPSHFSESTGELGVFCDTSGSMTGLYPTVFGEIARICENVRPESVRVIWWEYEVVGDQIFKPADYDKIAQLMQPAGGGGTRLTCVKEYIEAKKYKFKACIYLTDGYIESDYKLAEFPTLFGAVDNDDFVASKGKTIRIHSADAVQE